MTVHPLLILSLVAALALNRKSGSRRKLILISFAVYLLVLVATRIYFVPELMAFERSPGSGVSPAEWLARGAALAEVELGPGRRDVCRDRAVTAGADRAGPGSLRAGRRRPTRRLRRSSRANLTPTRLMRRPAE